MLESRDGKYVLVLFTLVAYIGGMSASSVRQRPPDPEFHAPGETVGSHVGADRRRGRGAQSNASGRYEPRARMAVDDGWQSIEELEPFTTSVALDTARKIITHNDSPDISFDRSINPYRGCEH